MHREIIVQMAVVRSTYPEERLVDVEWVGYAVLLRRIPVVTGPSDYSMPSVGDFGLVIGTENNAFYIGKIEINYQDKIKGKEDETTGVNMLARKVNDGGIFLGNLLKRAWLSITPGGDFSLANGAQNGVRYSARTAVLKLGGNLVSIIGNGVRGAVGAVMRDTPTPETIIPSIDNPTVAAVEAYFEVLVNTLRLARMHIGHVSDPVGKPELSSFSMRLRAILEVCDALGTSISSLKMDELGNIEITTAQTGNIAIGAATSGKITLTTVAGNIEHASTSGSITSVTQSGNVSMTSVTGQAILDGKPASGVMLAGSNSAYSAVLGETLLTWLNTHTHPTAMGPSGPPISPAPATLLSKKVKLG